MVLPHRLIPHLLTHKLVVPDFAAIREYWNHMFTHAEWGPGHPLAEQGEKCKHLPIYLYADDVKWTNEEKLTQVSLGMVLDERKHSMRTHFPLWILREVHVRAYINNTLKLAAKPTLVDFRYHP